MTHEQLQQIRTIVYDAYCEGDTEAEWMLVVIDAELAKPEPEHAATIMRCPAGDYVMVKAKLTLPAYELPDGTLLYTAPVDTPQDPKQAAIEQVSPTHYDQTALELCEVCGWKTLIPGDCCLNCERGKVEQEPVARPDEQTRRNLVSECGLEWDDSSKTSSTEPFAWASFDGEGSYDLRLYEDNENYLDEYRKMNGDKYAGWVTPLYTAPVPAPQREWQGLTAEQVNDVRRRFATNISVPYFVMIYNAIEAALKEKNHG